VNKDQRSLPFGDAKFYQKQQEIFIEMVQLLRTTLKILHHPYSLQMISRFIDVLEPTDIIDYGRLPYYNPKQGKALRKKKDECLFALVSYMVIQYWLWKSNGQGELMLRNSIRCVQEIVSLGLDKFTVIGDEKSGYELADNITKS